MKTLDMRSKPSKEECPCTEEDIKIYKDRISRLIDQNTELKDKVDSLKSIKKIPLMVSFMVTFFFNYLVLNYWFNGGANITQIAAVFIVDWFMSLFAYYGVVFGYWIYEDFEEGLGK
jgi:hypothetical protein